MFSQRLTVMNVWNMADRFYANQITSGRHVNVQVREGTFCAQSHLDTDFRSVQSRLPRIPAGIMSIKTVECI